jgi:hypothetical protein
MPAYAASLRNPVKNAGDVFFHPENCKKRTKGNATGSDPPFISAFIEEMGLKSTSIITG